MKRKAEEERLISTFMNEPFYMVKYSDILHEQLFTQSRQILFNIMASIKHSEFSMVVLKKTIAKKHMPKEYGGDTYLDMLYDLPHCRVAAEVKVLIESLNEQEARARTKSVAYDMLQTAENPKVDIYGYMDEVRNEMRPLRLSYSARSAEQLTKAMLGKEDSSYLKSKIYKIDQFSGGLEEGEFTIIAGATGMGKTSVGLHIFGQNVWDGVPMAYFSLEMLDSQIWQRIVSTFLKIDNKRIRKHTKQNRELEDVEIRRINEFTKDWAAKSYYIDDRSKKLGTLLNSMRQAIENGAKGIIVDYLQLVQFNGTKNREEAVATISRELNGLAKSERVPVIALSQLSRAHQMREDKRPRLADLRESGAIEQDADNVIMCYNDAYFHPQADGPDVQELELIIAKGRSIGVGKIVTGWIPRFTRIED